LYKILVVEDDPAIQEGLKELLSVEHYLIDKASDGFTAIKKTLQYKPDLILLDLNLPGKGGYDVCRELRGLNYRNPIIILSSKSEQVDKILGLELGADDYITKPFDGRELIARVRANLRKNNPDSEKTSQYEKKLYTVMFSDMYGYSQKMNHDELAALELLRIHNSIIKDEVKKYHGDIVEVIGDAFLVKFDSATSALESACSIQQNFKRRNQVEREENKILVRIGIHLGEVLVSEDNIKGEVLNIAARVQDLTDPGAVYVTGSVFNVLRNNKNFKMEYKGEFTLKNISKPEELYSVTRLTLEPA
jgi:two-component system, OmpR family, response regulator VicR